MSRQRKPSVAVSLLIFPLVVLFPVSCNMDKSQIPRAVPPAVPPVNEKRLPQNSVSSPISTPAHKNPSNAATEMPVSQNATVVARVPVNQSAPALAIGTEFLGRLTADSLVLYDLKHGNKAKRIPAKAPRGISTLQDGTLVLLDVQAPGTVSVVHIGRGGTRSVFPATMRSTDDELLRVFPDGSQPDRFWVLTPGSHPSLYGARLALVDGELDFFETLHPSPAATTSLSSLADGSLYFLDGLRLVSPLPPLRNHALPDQVGVPVHLASGTDANHVFVSTADGRIHSLELAQDRARSVLRIEPQPPKVYQLAGSNGRVAALLVDDTQSRAVRFTLAVFDSGGKTLLREELSFLPNRPPISPQTLVMSPSGLVAVGDAQHLAVFDLTTKKLRISEGLGKSRSE